MVKCVVILLEGMKPVSVITDTCATVETPTFRPYIDFVTSPQGPVPQLDNGRVGVAVGDCGCSAKCSDEFGRLAAQLMLTGEWTDDVLKHEQVRVRRKKEGLRLAGGKSKL